MNKILAKQVAAALIDIKAVGFSVNQPITFKSGIISPMYIDNRRLPAFPKHWRIILNGFMSELKTKNIQFDLIAGIETAGIPHSAGLGVLLKKPSVFVRKAAKDHGTKKMVEGGEVNNKTVLLIEDLVTTGGSSLHGVEELKAAGAKVTDCFVIVSYGFPESALAFKAAKVKLTALTDIATILKVAQEKKLLSAQEVIIVKNWHQDPWHWGK